MEPGVAGEVALDETARRALADLGYAGGTREGPEAFLTEGARDPKDMLVVLNQLIMAKQLTARKEYLLAIPMLEAAASQSPESPDILNKLADAYLKAGEKIEGARAMDKTHPLFEKAAENFRRSLVLRGNDQSALAGMGHALLRLEQYEEAIQHFEAARAVLFHSRPGVELHHAVALLKLGRVGEAMPMLHKLAREYPDLAEAHYWLAQTLDGIGRPVEALIHHRAIVRIKPEDAEAHYNLGVAQFNADQNSEAIESFRRALDLRLDYGDAMVNLGVALAKSGDILGGQTMLLKATNLPQVAAAARFNLGIIFLEQKNIRNATHMFEGALMEDPSHGPAVERLTAIYLSLSKFEYAIRVLRVGVEHHANDVRYHHTLAQLLGTSTDPSIRNGMEARMLATHAANLTRGQHPEVLGTLAAAYAEEGDFDKAMEVADRAISLAKEQGLSDLLEQLEDQREGYANGRPYRNPRF